VTGSWSAISALLAIAAVVVAVVSLVKTFLNKVGRKLFGILAIAFGAFTPVVWSALDSLSSPVTLLNSGTPVVLAVMAAAVVTFILRGNRKREEAEEDEMYSQEAYVLK